MSALFFFSLQIAYFDMNLVHEVNCNSNEFNANDYLIYVMAQWIECNEIQNKKLNKMRDPNNLVLHCYYHIKVERMRIEIC